ncbi:ADP-dependent (S)-NAD(P)H-hydrate dehydratase / NAD(P)H-hydrate epimerase [Desulfarculales bacterium]
MILATSQEMREADRRTIEEIGLPGIVLMENAAQGAARVFAEALGQVESLDLAAFCGRGNNGGDGLAILRILAGQGALCTAYLLARREDLSGDAATNLRVAKACGVEVVEVPNEEAFTRHQAAMASHDAYIDAILGTGLNTPVGERYALAIDFLNTLVQPVLSVDVPSGLCADSGQPLGLAVRADFTATFGLTKAGLALEPGEYVGQLHLVDIGIPPRVVEGLGCQARLLEPKTVGWLLPARSPGGHKGSFGHLMVVGGSLGKSGAVCLAALGGIKAGAGLVTAALPEALNQVAEIKLTAAMSQPLPQTNQGGLALKALEVLAELAAVRQAVVLGPGLGQEEESAELARRLCADLGLPLVVDADGLNALAQGLGPGAIASQQAVITPHPGEAARLLGSSLAAVQADRLAAARALAAQSRAVTVLKGARTVIAEPEGRAWINPTGNALLASGGSGDVLAGLIGGLLAQGVAALPAALCGVFVHGLAADMAEADYGLRGLAAEELLDYLPPAFASLEKPQDDEQDDEQ